MSNGVIYVSAFSALHLSECIYSAKSLKRKNPSLSITLFTDAPDKVTPKFFDEVIKIDSSLHPLKLKVDCMEKTPYHNTLFLDTDTKVEDSLSPLFDLIRNVDLVIARAPKTLYQNGRFHLVDFYHETDFNTGVVGYKMSKEGRDFIRAWNKVTKQQEETVMKPGRFCDQYHFNELMKGGLADRLNLSVQIVDNKNI